MSTNFGNCPPQLKQILHFLKLASDYENRNVAISYWARLCALQTGLKIDKSSESKIYLISVMDWLEKFKKDNVQNESITNEVAAHAIVENEAHRLFVRADSEDRASNFNKTLVKLFYTSGVLYDVCEVFGELSSEVATQRKYAKWKATYIHNCLKNGENPIPGPIGGDDDEEVSIPVPHIGEVNQPEDTELSSHIPSSNPEPEKHYGYVPEETPSVQNESGSGVSSKAIYEAQKCCKYAISALEYEDVSTAIGNLQKALGHLNPM